MKKILFIYLFLFTLILVNGQDPIPQVQNRQLDRSKLVIRPNSRDYAIIRKGNNHQRMLQIRTEIMIRQRQAILNRKMAMERRRQVIQRRIIRQQQIRQRMIRQRKSRP